MSKRNTDTFQVGKCSSCCWDCPLKQQNITMVDYDVLHGCRISIACKAFFQKLLVVKTLFKLTACFCLVGCDLLEVYVDLEPTKR